VSFPAWDDTTGIWFLYFDAFGGAKTTTTPWNDFTLIAPIYRIQWNATLSGSAKSNVECYECHQNTVPGIDHAWKHTVGTIWTRGGDNINNLLATGTPNADGRNTVIALTDTSCMDDNLPYTIVNSTGGVKFQQDLGNVSSGSLNATNSALLKVRFETSAGVVSTLPATRFPFAWSASTNIPEYITINGTRTPVSNKYFFVYFVYVLQDPRNGEAIRVVSFPTQYATLSDSDAATWAGIQALYSTLNDSEIRPLYKLTFEYNQTYNSGCKYSVLRAVLDIRKQAIAQLSVSSGSLPASNVTFVPTAPVTSTNVQGAMTEIINGGVKAITTTTGQIFYTKKINGITASTQGGLIGYAHNISPSSKIVSANCSVYTADHIYYPEHLRDLGCQYSFVEYLGSMYVINSNTNSSNILSMPFTIILTYE
jgi:hypothetical protein